MEKKAISYEALDEMIIKGAYRIICQSRSHFQAFVWPLQEKENVRRNIKIPSYKFHRNLNSHSNLHRIDLY